MQLGKKEKEPEMWYESKEKRRQKGLGVLPRHLWQVLRGKYTYSENKSGATTMLRNMTHECICLKVKW